MTPTNEAGHGLPYVEIIDLLKSAQSNIAAKRPDWDEDDAAHWDRIDAAVSALEHHESLALSRGVPADMVLAPLTPTDDMWEAFDEFNGSHKMSHASFVRAWTEVVATAALAAPAADGAQGEDYCIACKGSGDVMGLHRSPSGDPQDDYEAPINCPKCEGTGVAK